MSFLVSSIPVGGGGDLEGGGRWVRMCRDIFFRNIWGLVEVGKRQNNEHLDVEDWDQHNFHEIWGPETNFQPFLKIST